jgi:HEPN domain-containing protein
MDNKDKHEEWYFQSDYDLETAFDMFKTGRMVYCIFMCHLSIEKALKGLSIKKTGEFPSKSHSLIYFTEKLGLELDDSDYEFLFMLNKISVPTRYPDDLRKLFTAYTKERTESILNQTKELQSWIKQQ